MIVVCATIYYLLDKNQRVKPDVARDWPEVQHTCNQRQAGRADYFLFDVIKC